MSRYRQNNKFKKAWERATPEQRNAFRRAFKAAEAHGQRAEKELSPVYEELWSAWDGIYNKDVPEGLFCMYVGLSLRQDAERAFDDFLDCLGPGWGEME